MNFDNYSGQRSRRTSKRVSGAPQPDTKPYTPPSQFAAYVPSQGKPGPVQPQGFQPQPSYQPQQVQTFQQQVVQQPVVVQPQVPIQPTFSQMQPSPTTETLKEKIAEIEQENSEIRRELELHKEKIDILNKQMMIFFGKIDKMEKSFNIHSTENPWNFS